MIDKEKAIANLYESLHEMNILRKPEAKPGVWINVNDPPEAVNGVQPHVLLFFKKWPNIEMGCYNGITWTTGGSICHSSPTHWMPLPDPPEDEDE